MYTIPTNVVDNYASVDSLNNLIDRINNTILRMARQEWNAVRLGLKYEPDLDKYDDLMSYKYILMNKLLGCNCLNEQFLLYIVSRIKKLTR